MFLDLLSATIGRTISQNPRIYFPKNNSSYGYVELEGLINKFCKEFQVNNDGQHKNFIGVALSYEIESLVILIGLEVWCNNI